jgi:hypothetical protein
MTHHFDLKTVCLGWHFLKLQRSVLECKVHINLHGKLHKVAV